ncbi:hypothetical protein EJ08DRAFT_226401 [Tothia fuscella]|uniref:C2H2-type domain-containing protein n=1 Tax=Tothia fuscella TaxID=1048955 RepID=A0A9P4P2H7_9PEZI|nr:hypothetical protein EJ08DRAFT_226401 [Tothia fuscella]
MTIGSSSVTGKRSYDQFDGEDSEEKGDNGNPKRPKLLPKSLEGRMSAGRFACPFFKNCPERYQSWRSCSGPGWATVHRVKEHVYRTHALPIMCPRCFDAFDSETALRIHVVSPVPCHITETLELEGFTKEQEKLLRSRKRPAGQTEPEKWRNMFKILFPKKTEEEIPSPYVEPASYQNWKEVLLFKEFLNSKLPEKLREDYGSHPRYEDYLSDQHVSDLIEEVYQIYQSPVESTTPPSLHVDGQNDTHVDCSEQNALLSESHHTRVPSEDSERSRTNVTTGSITDGLDYEFAAWINPAPEDAFHMLDWDILSA